MLLKLPPGPVLVDGEEVCKDLKVNIKLDTWQGRIKFYDTQNQLVDILVQVVGKPKLTAPTEISIEPIVGIEEETGTQFKFRLGYNILKQTFKIAGKIGDKDISVSDKDIVRLIQTVINTCHQIM